MELMEHQKDAIRQLGNGKVLYGGVGTGKSATVLGYYVKNESPRDIYVITTAKKRDSLDWLGEAASFGIGEERDCTLHGVITIDSWNNVGKYVDKSDAFFVFDEQRVVGSGAWVKAFLKIAKKNRWVLLSATPGDTWLDYAPIFIANGWFKNITDFKRKHVLYEPFVKFPMVRGYLNETKLELMRNEILVEMPYVREIERVMNWMDVSYDRDLYEDIRKRRWNVFEDRPVKDVAELFRLLRRVVNSDPSRLDLILKLLETHPRMIIFYNFNYELDILRGLCVDVPVYEWNGHQKDPVPDGERWVYLVQYVAGAEGWNCTTTDAMVLYSLTYSYKNHQQALGRIDRLNTPFRELYYYVMLTNSNIDRAIKSSLEQKRNFNEREFMRNLEVEEASEEGVWAEEFEICQI